MGINGMKCKWMELDENKWAEHQDWTENQRWNGMQMNGNKWK